MVEKTFRAAVDALGEAMAFIDEQLEEIGCPMKAQMQIDVAAEEIFVNIAHYAYPAGDGEMQLAVDYTNGALSLRFTDSGTPFDPLMKADPDITLAAEDRDVGGLGIYMVKKTMDDVRYRYEDGKNILTLIKKV